MRGERGWYKVSWCEEIGVRGEGRALEAARSIRLPMDSLCSRDFLIDSVLKVYGCRNNCRVSQVGQVRHHFPAFPMVV